MPNEFDSRLFRQSLRTILLSKDDLPPIAWENRPFDPPAVGPWIEEYFSIIDQRQTGFKVISGPGVSRFDILIWRNQGTEEVEDLSNEIASLFIEGERAYSSGIDEVVIQGAQRLSPSTDELYYKLPVRVDWHYTAQLT